MNKLFLFVFVGLFASIYGVGTLCGGNAKELRISGCEEEPCEIKRGESGTLELDFKTSESSNTLTADITSRILNHNIPWPGVNGNACENSNIQCPVQANKDQTYKYNYKILSIYPHFQTTVTIRLLNENKKLEACYQVKVNFV